MHSDSASFNDNESIFSPRLQASHDSALHLPSLCSTHLSICYDSNLRLWLKVQTMAACQHKCLHSFSLREILEACLQQDGQESHIIICSSKERFVDAVKSAGEQQRVSDTATTADGDHHNASIRIQDLFDTALTLRSIAACRTLKLVFCHDLAHLRAYLASLLIPLSTPDSQSAHSNRLVLINMLHMHRSTRSWSAQSLNRSLAAAIDAAAARHSDLLLCEDATLQCESVDMDLPSSSPVPQQEAALSVQTTPDVSEGSIWDEEVGLIGFHVKTFGNSNTRWTGRPVKVRDVVTRYLPFHDEHDL